MKTILFNLIILLTISSTLFGQTLTYTTSVNSSPGQNYTVNITIVLTDIIPAQSNCTWGYNYDVAYDYNIEIIQSSNSNGNGNNSVNLNTLQGYLTCGGNTGIYFNLPNNGGSGSSVTQGNPWNSNSDCATATVESLECKFIDLHIKGPGIPNQYISLEPTPALPVEWLSFEVKNKNSTADLNWSTASEKNNDYFTVEKSIDGKKWVSLTEMEGAGNINSTSNYSWNDNNPAIGNSYYRIKQTDFDGKTDYSSIKSFSFENGAFTLYPNPATNVINIKSESQIESAELIVLNSFGQEITNKVYKTSLTQLDISSLTTGFYTIVVNGKSSKFQKL
jgi:hypothetical protein